MSWRVLLALVLCNAIWATNPMMGKILMKELSPLQVSWVRYAFALLSSCAILLFFRLRAPQFLSSWKESARFLPWLVVVGLVTFLGSAVFQYKGLHLSTSTANSLIVAMEPLFAVFLAWIFLGETVGLRECIAFVIAVLGFCLLSHVKPSDLGAAFSVFSIGNLLLLLSMPMEAMYSVVSRKLAGRVQPMSLFGIALPIGFIGLNLFLLASSVPLPEVSSLSPLAWLAIFWIGPLGTTITYTYWSVALVNAPVAAVSLTLFVQPILGAITGTFFLGERLDFWQIVGGLAILIALYLQTGMKFPRRKP